ncbi:MAG: Rieske 2Fe-2S domain-containing protein [Gemmatimonadota bacterium]|jgi:Rieske Fe-S protein|nr:Rieske 2Fe-2S domain-containing protein [Gemmatimonadota bacterium]
MKHDLTEDRNDPGQEGPGPDCQGCSISRRRAVMEIVAGLGLALAATGLSDEKLLAQPFAAISGLRNLANTITYPVPTADGVQIDKANDVILVRWGGMVRAFNLSCTHRNTALKWDDRTEQFYCTKHRSRFTTAGEFIPRSGRATRAMDRFAITREGATVRVDLNALYQADRNAAAWNAAGVAV